MIKLKKYFPLPKIMSFKDLNDRFQMHNGITTSFIGDLIFCLDDSQAEEALTAGLNLSDCLHSNYYSYFSFEPKKYLYDFFDADRGRSKEHKFQRSKQPIEYVPMNKQSLSLNNIPFYYANTFKGVWELTKKDFTLYPKQKLITGVVKNDKPFMSDTISESFSPEMTRQLITITEMSMQPDYLNANQDGFYDVSQYIDVVLPSLKRSERKIDSENKEHKLFFVEHNPVRRIKIRIVHELFGVTPAFERNTTVSDIQDKINYNKIYSENMKYGVIIDVNDWNLIKEDVENNMISESEAKEIDFNYHKQLKLLGLTSEDPKDIVNQVNKAEAVMNKQEVVIDPDEIKNKTASKTVVDITPIEEEKVDDEKKEESVAPIEFQVMELHQAGYKDSEIGKVVGLHHLKVKSIIKKLTNELNATSK